MDGQNLPQTILSNMASFSSFGISMLNFEEVIFNKKTLVQDLASLFGRVKGRRFLFLKCPDINFFGAHIEKTEKCTTSTQRKKIN